MLKLERNLQILKQGIMARKDDGMDIFEDNNVINWVIHGVINWIYNIGMDKYAKYFADFEQPLTGEKLTDYNKIYLFRLEIDYEIEREDALRIIKEIDKLREYLPGDPNIIDYDEEGRWLIQSFEFYEMRFRNNMYHKQRVNLRLISLE